ncbi:MAG: inorganic phosphate transporter [Acetobacteraceae bacterium]|nr:inorganic phosphate transporter [Acetobacteraceae bacterium]
MVNVVPSSPLAIVLLVLCFILVLAFEAANGFHDTANAVATVIYTNSLKPKVAVVWSGMMNFLGVLIGGIAVAYALVELLPAEVLSPPNGSPAIPMLIALFITALAWNVFTWWFGIPNSSSHCVIGALIGVALGNAIVNHRGLTEGVDWSQIWKVLRALAVSPLLGFVGAGLLYFAVKHVVKDPALYHPPEGDRPPPWGVRGLLILTCTSVSFSHGTNDGQKSIGLIMLTIIGLLPAAYALNPTAVNAIPQLPEHARAAAPLIERLGDDQKQLALEASQRLQQAEPQLESVGAKPGSQPNGAAPAADAGKDQQKATKSAIRDDVYRLITELKAVGRGGRANSEEKAEAAKIEAELRPVVEFAPWWVRVLSATCLGVGTMVGYKRIVRTLGERVGKTHLTPAQGASAELVGAGLIATAGFTGLPVSTTHIITSGIAGTMVGSGSGLNRSMLLRIAAAWVFTLPVTIGVAAGLFYILGGRPG